MAPALITFVLWVGPHWVGVDLLAAGGRLVCNWTTLVGY